MTMILKFEGTNCPSCKKLDKLMELSGWCDDYIIHTMNNEEDLDLFRSHGVTTVPTLIKVVVNGDSLNEIDRLEGLKSVMEYKKFFE